MQKVNDSLELVASIQQQKMNCPGITNNPKVGRSFRQFYEASMNTSLECIQKKYYETSLSRKDIDATKEFGINMIKKLQDRNNELNRLIQHVLDGNKVDSGEMLALQGKILNFSRDITAVSKVIESLVSSLKTLMQTQV
ncbi:MAG: hypothetical protein WBM02_01755 [bacterium]